VQYFLAHQRFLKVQNGQKLSLADFRGEHLTDFEKNCPEFSNAIYLMETFYEDPYMFFENTRDFVDSHQKNDSFEALGDFIDSHSKNGSFAILGDLADSHPKRALSCSIWFFLPFFK
jgi:hypothetical protein